MRFALILQIIAVLIHACAYFVMHYTSHHNKQQSLMSNINRQICFIQATLFTLLILLLLNDNDTNSISVYDQYYFRTILDFVSFHQLHLLDHTWFHFHCCLFVFLSSFANMLEIFYNIELILFLKKPISNFSTRGKLYTTITWLVSIVSFIVAYYQQLNSSFTSIEMFRHAKVNILILSVYVLVSIFSMVYMGNFLRSQSRFYSTERKFFGIRFMLYVVLVIVGYGLVCMLVIVSTNVKMVLIVLDGFGIVLGVFRAFDIGKVLKCCVNVRDIEREPILNTVQINSLRESIHKRGSVNDGSKRKGNNYIKKTSNDKITTLLLSTSTNNNDNDDASVVTINNNNDNNNNNTSSSSTTLSMLLQSNVIMEYMFYLLHGINIIADLTYNNKHKKLALTSITSDKFREITIHKFMSNPLTSSSSSQELSVQSQTISNNTILNNLYIWFQMVKGNILLEEHAPKVFRNLFEITNLTLSKIKNSFDPHLNQNVISNITMSEGKSGSFFFFTHDKRYMIKTISQKELDALTGDFLIDYYAHITENRYTFLSKIYGAYTLCYGLSKINIIVMENVAPMKEGEVLLRRFDLKGSVKGRITKNVNLENRKQTLKDLDYLDLKSTFDEGLEFTSDKNLFDLFGVFRNDIRMLCKHGLMDYSFFFTVCRNERSTNEVDDENVEDEDTNSTYVKVHRSKDGKYVYYVGIIDYLTMFDRIKYFEGKIKMFGNKESNLVSSVEPAVYEGRFLRFVWKNVFEIHKNKKFIKRGSFSNFMEER